MICISMYVVTWKRNYSITKFMSLASFTTHEVFFTKTFMTFCCAWKKNYNYIQATQECRHP